MKIDLINIVEDFILFGEKSDSSREQILNAAHSNGENQQAFATLLAKRIKQHENGLSEKKAFHDLGIDSSTRH